MPMRVRPFLPLGGSHPYPEQIRICLVDSFNYRPIVLFRKLRLIGWRIGFHFDVRIIHLYTPLYQCQYFFTAAHEKTFPSGPVQLVHLELEQIPAGNALCGFGFNSEPGSSVVAHVQKDGVLHDVKQVAARKSCTEWSFSDFGQILEAERPLLDYIFVSDGIAADLYEVLPDTLGGGYVSDHAPVMAIVKFEK